jgi:hypothetical protein
VPTILNALNHAALHRSRADFYDGEGPIPSSRAMRSSLTAPRRSARRWRRFRAAS